jgi:hypothetical protein
MADSSLVASILAKGIALRPAPNRGDAIAREHWLAIVEHKAWPQSQNPAPAVVFDVNSLDHLRRGNSLSIRNEQRVEYEIAMIAGDVSGGPVRIDYRHVRIRMNRSTRTPSARTRAGEASAVIDAVRNLRRFMCPLRAAAPDDACSRRWTMDDAYLPHK